MTIVNERTTDRGFESLAQDLTDATAILADYVTGSGALLFFSYYASE